MWHEVNQRVNYPIKKRIIEMEENGIIDMSSPTTKFCVSFVCTNVATVGVKLFAQAWNCHPIARIVLLNNNYTCVLTHSTILTERAEKVQQGNFGPPYTYIRMITIIMIMKIEL